MKILAKAWLEGQCLVNLNGLVWTINLQRQGSRDNFEYLFSDRNNRAKDMSEVFGIS